MSYIIKELREKTGMTQKEFAEKFAIPVSTLRKWEQGEATPASYVISLIAMQLPDVEMTTEVIETADGLKFYYDRLRKMISDSKGNKIPIHEDLNGVKRHNLKLYVSDLFDSYYAICERFNNDCKIDKQEDVLWG